MSTSFALTLIIIIVFFVQSVSSSSDDNDSSFESSEEDSPSSSSSRRNQLLLISLDGFRYDYLHHKDMKSLKMVSQNGVHSVNGMKGIFSTVTFASHWTVATGLWEESHGIIANTFYDPVLNDTFVKSSTDRKWWGGEPIWVTAKKQRRSVGIYFWPGSPVDFGIWPDKIELPYNNRIPLRKRIDAVIDWLTKDQLDFVMMYFHEPDKSGHEFGSFSDAVMNRLGEVDAELTYLFETLKVGKADSNLNVIVISDHGMTNSTDQPEVELSDAVEKLSKWISYSDGVVSHFWPKDGQKEKLVKTLRDSRSGSGKDVKKYEVYEREDIPERWKYRHHHRIGDVIAVADEGYFVSIPSKKPSRPKRGRHGYDNDLESMRPLFMATGPDIKRDYHFDEPISMINMYALVCGLLKIKPSPNNGSLNEVGHILRHPVDDYKIYKSRSDRLGYLSLWNILVLIVTLVKSTL